MNQTTSNNNTKKVLAAFDFDGTITTKDTLFDFGLFVLGWPKFLSIMLVFLPTAIGFVTHKISNSQAKEVLFSLYFKFMKIEIFQEYCQKYSERIPFIINSDALEKINWHKSQGHHLVIVSASIENWIIPWAQKMGFEKVIATKAEIINGKLSGLFLSPNCNGPEKTIRLLAEYPQRAEYQLYAYGDTQGDASLLKEADFAFYKKFN